MISLFSAGEVNSLEADSQTLQNVRLGRRLNEIITGVNVAGALSQQSDYVIKNVTELDNALSDILARGYGGTIYCKAGTYDKGSAFIIPDVWDISIFSEGGAVFIRPDADDLIQIGTGSVNLTIKGLVFRGKNIGDYAILNFNGSYGGFQCKITGNSFWDNYGDFVRGEELSLIMFYDNFFGKGFFYYPFDGNGAIINTSSKSGNISFMRNKVDVEGGASEIFNFGVGQTNYPKITIKQNEFRIDTLIPPSGNLINIGDIHDEQTFFTVIKDNIFKLVYITYTYFINIDGYATGRGIIAENDIIEYGSTPPSALNKLLSFDPTLTGGRWTAENNREMA